MQAQKLRRDTLAVKFFLRSRRLPIDNVIPKLSFPVIHTWITYVRSKMRTLHAVLLPFKSTIPQDWQPLPTYLDIIGKRFPINPSVSGAWLHARIPTLRSCCGSYPDMRILRWGPLGDASIVRAHVIRSPPRPQGCWLKCHIENLKMSCYCLCVIEDCVAAYSEPDLRQWAFNEELPYARTMRERPIYTSLTRASGHKTDAGR